MLGDVAMDRRLEINHRVEGTALEPAPVSAEKKMTPSEGRDPLPALAIA